MEVANTPDEQIKAAHHHGSLLVYMPGCLHFYELLQYVVSSFGILRQSPCALFIIWLKP